MIKDSLKIEYTCQSAPDFDDITVNISDFTSGDISLTFMYKVICNKDVLFKFDVNMLVLFGISILTIYVAFHTPELRMIQNMSKEEIEETEFKTWQAVGFFVGASISITLLYLFMDYIMVILTIWVTFAATIAMAVILQDFLSYSK